MLYSTYRKGDITLKQRLYQTGQFAKKASVTLRTLRFYDKVGLLSPTQHTDSGYRLYGDEDLLKLEQILALKFLGLSLDEIRFCLERGPGKLEHLLAQQREMMLEKRAQLDSIVDAIGRTEALLQSGSCDWESIARVIQVIRMEQQTDWVKKYFTDEQRQRLGGLVGSSYSPEALAKFQQAGPWTEEDQKRADADWRHVADESNRLAAAGADPAGEEAQALAKFKSDLLAQFTQNDPEVEAGLVKFWENFKALPAEEQPFQAAPYMPGDPGADLLEKAMAIYQEREKSSS